MNLLKSMPIILVFLTMISCQTNNEKSQPITNQIVNKESINNEIMKVEKAFMEMVRKEGMTNAFLHFAADNAILNRNDSLYRGKEAIRAYFESSRVKDEDIILTWTPEFVDVSTSGDMAYTYGEYTFSIAPHERPPLKGVFHTVWKKQEHGEWKYVWD